MAPLVSLESVPIVDNHCHASQLELRKTSNVATILQSQEVYARGFIEARIPPQSWREYVSSINQRDAQRLEKLDREHHVRDLMDRSLEMFATTTFTRALQIGCMELHGEWENRERLAEVSGVARENGLAPLYERALDRVNSPFVLTDTPRLDRSRWSERRFKWIVRLDPFLYPFGPGVSTIRGTEVAGFHARFAAKLEMALREQGLEEPPTSFEDYLAFVDRVVESFIQRGVVSFKFVSAYVRSLEFLPVAQSEAQRVFHDLARGRKEESRLFEDFMARRLLLQAAERGVPVQFHTGLGHGEPGMEFRGNSPLRLQSILMDEQYSNLKVVLLHGSYPFCSEAGALVWSHGNVHLDFSLMVCLHHHFLIDRLSEWLELLPGNRLLFGTDTGLPEMQVGATRLGRRAIEVALSRGVEDGLWSMPQAEKLGERVCYRNVCDLYGLDL